MTTDEDEVEAPPLDPRVQLLETLRDSSLIQILEMYCEAPSPFLASATMLDIRTVAKLSAQIIAEEAAETAAMISAMCADL